MMPVMAPTETEQDSEPCSHARFATTHWSVVRQAAGSHSSERLEALERICRTYWYPLYAFARKRGATPADAQDLTQGFFLHLLEGQLVSRASPEGGKFRSFLLASFQYFISHEQARADAQKRGGGAPFAIDSAASELRFGREPVIPAAPESLFERSWAMKVLEQALDRLAGEFRKNGKERYFNELSPLLEGEKAEGGYAAVARKLGTTEGTIRWAVNRFRNRYRDLIREVIAETASSPAEVEEEVQHLIAVLRG